MDFARDLFKRNNKDSSSQNTYKSTDGNLDHRQSKFKDMFQFVSPLELKRPVRGHLNELDVTVGRLRNVSLR